MLHDNMDFLSEIVFVYSWYMSIPIDDNCLYLHLMTISTSVWSMEYEWMKCQISCHIYQFGVWLKKSSLVLPLSLWYVIFMNGSSIRIKY